MEQNGKEEKKAMNEEILFKHSQINQNVKNEEKSQKIKKEQLSVRLLFIQFFFFLLLFHFFQFGLTFYIFSFYNRMRKRIMRRKPMKKRFFWN